MINQGELSSSLKSRLHSRMIPFETYIFANGAANILVTLKSNRFSVTVPYLIDFEDDQFYLVTPNDQINVSSVTEAVGKLVLDVRRIEVKFHKWQK